MISQVREICDLVSHHLGTLGSKFPIIRKEQSAKKPQYPYGAYKIISVSGTGYSSKGQTENADPTKISELYRRLDSATVSLSFYIAENTQGLTVPAVDVIYDLAERALDFLQKEGREKFRTVGVNVELFDFAVQDRTVYLDTVYEYQVGFDFKVKAAKDLTLTFDAVDIDATIAGIQYNYQ